MHRQLNHVWRSRRLVLFADVSRVTAPRRLSTSQRESTRRSAALIYFRLKPPRLLFSPGFVPTLYVGTTWTEKTRVVQETTGRRMINWGSFLREERRRKSLSPPSRANLFYVWSSGARGGEWLFLERGIFVRGCVADAIARFSVSRFKRRFISYRFVTVMNADSGGAGNRVTNPTAAGDYTRLTERSCLR